MWKGPNADQVLSKYATIIMADLNSVSTAESPLECIKIKWPKNDPVPTESES